MLLELAAGLISTFLSNFAYVAILGVAILFYLSTKDNDFFEKRGVRHQKPLPFIGNMLPPFIRKVTFPEYYRKIYLDNNDVSTVGIFEFAKRVYMIRDPELIKQVCIKDFDSFVNHRITIEPESDPIFGRNIFAIKDQRWKHMRTVLSPAFTGSKMRFLFDLIRDCAHNSMAYVERTTRGDSFEFEAKDFFTRISNDVIATSAFGIEVNSIEETQNTFYKNGLKLARFDPIVLLKFFMYVNFPYIMSKFKIRLLDVPASDYFRDIVLEAMKYREANGVVRPDIIHLLLQSKSKMQDENGNSDLVFTDDDFVAQSVLFFLAGFDTTSTMFSFMAYELALNQDIQDRLRDEVRECVERLEGKPPTYEDINKMKYMDMVVQESLRKWPPSVQTDRLCNKATTLVDAKGKKIEMQPGDSIVIPIYGLHYDPQYFPDPEKFDPERFSDENKNSVNPFVYTPFGLGPRQCIGNRFALMECKILFYFIMAKFRIAPNAKTQVPLTFQKGVFLNNPEKGIWLDFRKL